VIRPMLLGCLDGGRRAPPGSAIGLTMSTADADDRMSRDEAAIRTALNVLRDIVQSGRMPSGLPLEPAVRDMHERAIDHLEELLRQIQAFRAASSLGLARRLRDPACASALNCLERLAYGGRLF